MKSSAKGYIVGVGSRLDNLQTGLDLIGMTEIPIISQASDLTSAGISLIRGDYVGAGLSIVGLLPVVGQATGAMKMARRTAKVLDAASGAKQTEKFLMLTGKAKGITNPKAQIKKAVAKNSEVGAKPVQKTKIKEKEKIDINETNIEPTIGKKLDVWDNGLPYQSQGVKTNMKNSAPSPKNVQKENYQRLIEQTEQGKIRYNPTNATVKPTPYPRGLNIEY